MPINIYKDFVIYTDYIDGEGADEAGALQRFSLRVFDSPVGEEERDEAVNVRDWNQLHQWRKLLAEREISREDFETFAQRLGEIILPPDANKMYQSSRQNLQDGEGLRVRLRLVRELAILPWEYALVKLHKGEITPLDYWALDGRVSVVRHEAINKPAAPFHSNPHRRVIFTMASPEPYDVWPRLDLEDEQQAIKSALKGMLGVEPEYHPDFERAREINWASLDIIRRSLQGYAEIFHFSGHGKYRAEDHTGIIVLAGVNNQAEEIKGEDLSSVLADGGIRLVVLDACETGKRDTFLQWSSVAATLLQAGIPAVISMQFSVYDDLTKEFARILYQSLVAGVEIDKAVALGRAAMRRVDSAARDWGAPVLYLRNSGGYIFPPVTDEKARLEAEEASQSETTLGEIAMRWLQEGTLAHPDQLELLRRSGNALRLGNLEAVLLLKSAIRFDRETGYWVERLQETGKAWLQEIDGKSLPPPEQEVDLAEKQLGLDVRTLSTPKEGNRLLAWSSVHNQDPLTRQTAALALLALSPDSVIEQIQKALLEIGGSAERRQRRASVFGLLAETDPEIEPELSRHVDNFQDRGSVWWWRVRRHFQRAKTDISRWAFGGALGAALALALYRAVLAVFNARPMGTEFAIYSYFGFLVGLGLVFGKLVAAPLLLRDPRDIDEARSRRLRIMPVLLAGLGFSLANGIAAWMNGIGVTWITFLRFLMITFIAGGLLSLGLYRQPGAGWHLGFGGWVRRLGAAAVLLALVQLPVICEAATRPGGGYWLDNVEWLAATVIEPSEAIVNKYRLFPFLDGLFNRFVPGESGSCCFAGPASAGGLFSLCAEQLLSVLDAALVGIVLVLGITAGMHFSDTRLGKVWRRIKEVIGFGD